MSPADVDFLTALVRARSGQALRGDRAFFAESRLAPVARREAAASVDDLVDRFRNTGAEPLGRALVEALVGGETAFFRDAPVFRELAEEVLPRLAARRPDRSLRLWSAGCATGQEPYSLAMLVDGPPRALEDVRFALLATDIAERALEKAQAGVYSQFEVQRGLPIRLLLKHFEKADDTWRLSARLRGAVRFGRMNLLDDFSRVGRVDVILCRNVLGTMEAQARFSVLERLAGQLAEDGCLVVGAGETVELAGFDPIRPGACVFLRNPEYARAAA